MYSFHSFASDKQTHPTHVFVAVTHSRSPTIQRKEFSLSYWRPNHLRFPKLAEMTRTYLSSPCTSVDSERLFSSAAHILTEERNRLEPKKAEMLLFIKKNLRVGSNAKKEHYKAMRPTYFSILNLRTLCCVTL